VRLNGNGASIRPSEADRKNEGERDVFPRVENEAVAVLRQDANAGERRKITLHLGEGDRSNCCVREGGGEKTIPPVPLCPYKGSAASTGDGTVCQQLCFGGGDKGGGIGRV